MITSAGAIGDTAWTSAGGQLSAFQAPEVKTSRRPTPLPAASMESEQMAGGWGHNNNNNNRAGEDDDDEGRCRGGPWPE